MSKGFLQTLILSKPLFLAKTAFDRLPVVGVATLAAVLGVCISQQCHAQPPSKVSVEAATSAVPRFTSDMATISNRQLEVIAAEQRKAQDYDHPVKPLELQKAILKRLRSERYTSDRVIEQTVRLVISCEQSELEHKQASLGGPQGVTTMQLPDTLHFIDAVLPLVEERTALQAWLHEQKAYLFLGGGNEAGRLKEAETVLALLTPFNQENDKHRMDAMIIVAEGAEQKGDKKTADELYYGVSLYPWWRIRGDPEALSDFTRLYARSVESLIRVREGNLPALKAITYAPAIRLRVERLYKEALERAEEASVLRAGK